MGRCFVCGFELGVLDILRLINKRIVIVLMEGGDVVRRKIKLLSLKDKLFILKGFLGFIEDKIIFIWKIFRCFCLVVIDRFVLWYC